MLFVLFFIMLFSINTTVLSNDNVYHKTVPLIIKNISPESPSESDQALLNGASAFIQCGVNDNPVCQETIQAVSSVDFFSTILPQYIKTQTVSGTIQAAFLTTQMTDDIALLQQRQELIKYLNNDNVTYQQLHTALDSAQKGERELFSFFKPISQEQQQAYETLRYQTSFTSEMFKKWNNKYILGFFKRSKQLGITHIPTIASTFIATTANLCLRQGVPFQKAVEVSAKTVQQMPKMISNLICHTWQHGYIEQKAYMVYMIAYLVAMEAYMIYDTKQDFDIIYDQQKRLIQVAQLMRSMKKISTIIEQHDELQTVLQPEMLKLQELFDANSTKTSSDLKYLISELLSPSFEGDASYYLSKQGKILAAHYYLNLCKEQLITYLEAMGKVDAYLAVATLYQNFQNHPRVTFCMPTFVDNPTPVLEITGYWHPLIDPNVVVTNDLVMGNNGIKNLMITGPNAGGKTTSLMSLIINIIFAQTFGIAPSATLTLTPFAKIHSYLDITTNLQEGLSLFAAEVDRAKKLKQSILSCTPKQKTFTIIDEIFSGTNPQVASDVGFKFASNLGDINHSMTIITTHFPRLTDIEAEVGTFTNYKVADATLMADGTVVYPFTLVPGISTQNIAQHMLEQADVL